MVAPLGMNGLMPDRRYNRGSRAAYSTDGAIRWTLQKKICLCPR